MSEKEEGEEGGDRTALSQMQSPALSLPLSSPAVIPLIALSLSLISCPHQVASRGVV
jgi:hypothetical protein